MLRLISVSLRGASTVAEPRYVSSVNTVLSPSRNTNDVDIVSDFILQESTSNTTHAHAHTQLVYNTGLI